MIKITNFFIRLKCFFLVWKFNHFKLHSLRLSYRVAISDYVQTVMEDF